MKGWMYILECGDGSYYTGSTNNLELRIIQHQCGEGANHTRKHPPVKLVYFEEFQRIDHAFMREKQVQGWSRKKKQALINNEHYKLPELASASTGSASTGSAAATRDVASTSSASTGSAAATRNVASTSSAISESGSVSSENGSATDENGSATSGSRSAISERGAGG